MSPSVGSPICRFHKHSYANLSLIVLSSHLAYQHSIIVATPSGAGFPSACLRQHPFALGALDRAALFHRLKRIRKRPAAHFPLSRRDLFGELGQRKRAGPGQISAIAVPMVCRASGSLCVADFRFAFAFKFPRGAGAVSSASSSRSAMRRSVILASSSVIFARMCSIDVFMARCLSRERRVVTLLLTRWLNLPIDPFWFRSAIYSRRGSLDGLNASII